MQPDQNIVELLRFIVRCNPLDLSEAGNAPIAPITDWDTFTALAEQHRIGPLCHAVLEETGGSAPHDGAQALVRVRERHTLLNLGRAAELLQVLDAFQAAEIAAVPFKGVALAAQLYGDFTLRAAGDLDLFIRWEDMKRAAEVVLARGYKLATPLRPDGRPIADNYFEYHFERPADGMVLELRWKLDFVHVRYPHVIGLDWIGSHRHPVRLAGGEVPALDAEETLLLLCMHGCKHVWSRLNWVCDVAQLLRTTPQLEWSRLEARATEAGLQKAVALGLLLAESVTGVAIPRQVAQDFDSFPSIKPLAEFIASDLFEAPGRIRRSSIPYHVRLLGRADLAGFVFSKEMLRPTRRDQELFPLPPSLRWMHFIIRPFRLLIDRSAR